MNKKLLLGLALVILVQGSLVLALDCTRISQPNYQVCLEILNSNLTLIEKEAIISNLEYNSSYFPDHNYIFLRNTAIRIRDAPYSVTKTNSIYIKNAWVSIFSLMPSILYNNSLYCSEEGLVLTGYNYSINLPDNYYSASYPSSNQGDCKRTYTKLNENSENRILVNNGFQGFGRLVNLTLTRDSDIQALFNISTGIQIDHYRWNSYCCRYRGNRCIRTCHDCVFSNSESKNDKVLLQDFLNVRLYNNSLFAEVMPIDSYNGNTKLKINFSDSIELNFNNSYFNNYKYIYSINYSKEPYYIFTLKATDYNKSQFHNLLRNENELVLRNSQDCNVLAFDFFNIIRANCNSNYLGFDFNITLDRFYYADNQTIKVSIFPQNISLFIAYGNQSKYASSNTTFIAKYPANKIVATYEDNNYEKIIFVFEKSKVVLLWKLFLFFLLVYILYRIAKRHFRRAND